MQDPARRAWDGAVGKAVMSRKGEGLPWELPRGRDGIFISSSCESTGLRAGLRSIRGN